MTNDSIGDLLARIKNAQLRKKDSIIVPYSKILEAILTILTKEGFVLNYKVNEESSSHKDIIVELKYINGQGVIENLKRVSKPGLRRYIGYKDIKKVLNGVGISIISTPKGVMTGENARKSKLGGEYICEVW